MNEVTVRRAIKRDAERLAEVYRSAYQENRRLGFPAKAENITGSTVTKWIREDWVLLAEVTGDVVGGVRLEATDATRVKLSRLGVHADWKGNGIGGLLLDAAEELARHEGYTHVWLTTPEAHPYLPDLYRRRGYDRTGTYPLDYREYDEIVMVKTV